MSFVWVCFVSFYFIFRLFFYAFGFRLLKFSFVVVVVVVATVVARSASDDH